jgi:predicted DNA-binding transcriptional regulator AlpA
MADTTTYGPSRIDAKPIQPVVLNVTIDVGSLAPLVELLRRTVEPVIAEAVSGTRPAATPAQPPATVVGGTKLNSGDRLTGVDLRLAILTGKIPEDTGLLIDRSTLALLLGVSSRTLDRFSCQGSIPSPVRIGRGNKWRLAEILEWIEADCPPQKVWAQKKQNPVEKKGR